MKINTDYTGKEANYMDTWCQIIQEDDTDWIER